jgi:hypothetical protein
MRTNVPLADHEALGRLSTRQDFDDGIESLSYWRERRRRLPWYRRRARREAERMALRWERRIAASLLSPSNVPVATRVSAGLLVARTRLARWSRLTRIGLLATVPVLAMLVVVPVVAGLVLVLNSI